MSDGAAYIIAQDDDTTVIVSQEGATGADALQDAGFSYEAFSSNQLLRAPAFAHPLTATVAASVAYTGTPPQTKIQVVTLYRNGVQIGTATWQIGATFGVIALNADPMVFVGRDAPAFGTPGDLDLTFTHFAITYAGP